MAATISASLTEMGADLLPALTIGAVAEGTTIAGDHPIPGDASARAAAAIDAWVRELNPNADVHIALSGGASAMMAAPLPGLSDGDLRDTFRLLLGSGLDINEMNAVRKRICRWSAGRLARALAPRRTFVWIISDVPGDDPATIASGPCHGDLWGASTVRELLDEADIWRKLSRPVQEAMAVETMKPGAAGLGEVRTKIVARNSDALQAAAAYATSRGVVAHIVSRTLSGEAADAGRAIARRLVKAQAIDWPPGILVDLMPQPPELWLYGGETVVTLGDSASAGGRNQELALAAAEVFAGVSFSPNVMLLAAGTDGRDGATPAAGAIVEGSTWGRIATKGRNPAADLAHHDSHAALAAAEALLQTGHTGTNVMDVVLGFSDRWEQFDRVAPT
jgi:hydroxypyruvate reductase